MLKLSLAAILLSASSVVAAQQTGVSNPPDSPVEVTTQSGAQESVPVVTAPVVVVQPGSTAPAAPAYTAGSTVPALPSASANGESPAITLNRRDLAAFRPAANPDGMVVGDDVVDNPYQVNAGTMLRARLRESINTTTTQPGSPFRAEISEALVHDGRVVVPAGSMLEGQVTEVRGGTRIHGPALLHLQPQVIVLPDGSRMPLHASVIDTDQYHQTRIDGEGNIVRKDHAKQTVATIGLGAGAAAAAGGLIAGAPGALIGAGVGAGIGTVVWLRQDRQASLPAETQIVLALTAPLPIQPLVHEPNYAQGSNYAPQPQYVPPTAPTTVPAQPATAEPQAFVPMN